MRMAIACLICLASVAGCAPTEQAADSDLPDAPVVTTPAPDAGDGRTTTSTEATSSTVLPKLFEVASGPVDGQYTTGTIPPTNGGVRPEASVTLNGVLAQLEYCDLWWEWEDVYCWAFGGRAGLQPLNLDADDVGLEPGLNVVELRAVFEDGETMESQLTLHYAPELVEVEGWLVDLLSGDPVRAVVDFVDLEPGEDDGIDTIGQPERRAVPVAKDAAFIVLVSDTISAKPAAVLTVAELAKLVEREKAGDPMDDLYWGRVLFDDRGGVPSTFLLTTNGELQQMEQWWSP
jgi:hypothetical protein